MKGNVYFRTKKPGVVKMNASICRYDLATKAKLQVKSGDEPEVKMMTGAAGTETQWWIRHGSCTGAM